MTESRRCLVPPQSGRALRVPCCDLLRVTDVKGRQVADLWAFATDDGLEWLSTSQTRDINERMFPRLGEGFYSDRGRLLLTLVEDASPGPHDMLFPACDGPLFERAGFPDHPNCRDNLFGALRGEGIELPFCPDPVDFFQNSSPQEDGRLEVHCSLNPPGGHVVLGAERDLLVVVTACSVDYHPTNGGVCTEILVEVLPGEPGR